MRIDENFRVFGPHHQWYDFIQNKGYIPTESAPTEMVLTMIRYNAYTYHSNLHNFKPYLIDKAIPFLMEKGYGKAYLGTQMTSEDGIAEIEKI